MRITLIDDRGRTVCKFVKDPDSDWYVEDPPPYRNVNQKQAPPDLGRQNFAESLTLRRDGVSHQLRVPGLRLNWARVTPILDVLAANGISDITIAQLRAQAANH